MLPTRSGVLRAVSERKILDLFSTRLAAISLSGYIFFGSSVSISDQVCLTRWERQYAQCLLRNRQQMLCNGTRCLVIMHMTCGRSP